MTDQAQIQRLVTAINLTLSCGHVSTITPSPIDSAIIFTNMPCPVCGTVAATALAQAGTPLK